MGQFGMQMPGGRQARGDGPDVFTALAFAGFVAVLAAVAALWIAGARVAPGGMPFNVQEAGSIDLPE